MDNYMTASMTKKESKYNILTAPTIMANNYVVLPGQIEEDKENINIPLGENSISSFLDNLSTKGSADQKNLIQTLKNIAASEKMKETAFLLTLSGNKIFQDRFSNLVEPLKIALQKVASGTITDTEYTHIFTLLEVTNEGIDQIKNIINNYKNTQIDILFLEALREEIQRQLGYNIAYQLASSIPADLNIDFVEIIKNTLNKIDGVNINLDNPETSAVGQEMINYVMKVAGFTGTKGNMDLIKNRSVPLRDFLDFKITGKVKGNTIKQQIVQAVKGMARGIGAEIKSSTAKGISTLGTRALTGLSSINDLEATYEIEATLTNSQLKNGDIVDFNLVLDKLKQIETELGSIRKKFKVSYSSKMYMPKELQKGKWSLDQIARDYKIVGGSPLRAKRDQLLGMGDMIGSADIKQLYFMLNNLGTGALYENSRTEVLNSLATVTSMWMFGESNQLFLDSIKGFSAEASTSSTLHLYVLNGIYVPLSTVLNRLANELQSSNNQLKSEIVKVSLSQHDSIGFYKTNIRKNDNLVGLSRWNTLRNDVEEKVKITVELNKILTERYLNFLQ